MTKLKGVDTVDRVSSRKLYWGKGGGGSSVIIMKDGHDQLKSTCGLCSKLGYCEGVVEEFGGEVGELGREASPPPRPPWWGLQPPQILRCTMEVNYLEQAPPFPLKVVSVHGIDATYIAQEYARRVNCKSTLT